MTRPAFFLALESDGGWACRATAGQVETHRFTCPTSGPGLPAWVPGGTGDGPPADAATSAAETLATLGYRGEGLVLGLPSAQVYSAEVASDGLPRKDRRQALTYRLEEHLPLDAESLTADFLPPLGGRTFGVAVETAPVGDLIERLARAGIEMEAVCPTALLALWHLVDHLDGAAGFCLMGQAGGVDVFRIRDGRPVSWHTVEADPGEAAQAVQVDLLAQPPEDGAGGQLVAADLGPEFLEAVAGRTGLVCRHVDEASAVALAAQAAPAVLEGRGAGWVNLRRGDLAPGDRLGRLRRPLQAAAALVLVLLAVVTGGAWWRAGRYEAQAAGHIEEQRAVFLRLYPNQRVPGSVRRHLASEATRLAALAGTDQAVPDRPAALDTARRVVSGLPADLRARLVMLRIEPAEVYLEGQARSHADAEAVARGIAAQGLAMEPPRTESLAKGGVAFTLAGRPAAPPAPKTGSSPVAAKGGRP